MFKQFLHKNLKLILLKLNIKKNGKIIIIYAIIKINVET